MAKKIYKPIIIAAIFLFGLLSGNFSPPGVLAQSDTVTVTHKPTTGIGAPPSVITRLDKGYETALLSPAATEYPQSVIIKVNVSLQVIGSDGESIGQALTEVYPKIKNNILAVIEIETQNEAVMLSQNFIQPFSTYDLAVMSKNRAVRKKIRDLQPKVRGIWDASEEDLSSISPLALANLTNKSKASTIVISQTQADTRLINGLLAKLKGVWVIADSNSEKDIYTVLTSGAYGIICDNYPLVYSVFKEFGANSILRPFQNIGHRGLSAQYPENTMPAFIAAFENGATHIELDAYLCKSGELVIMHDDNVDRMTNGTGYIKDLTLSQIKQLNIKFGSNITDEKVPTLEEVFDEFLYKPVIIVLEIKGGENVGIHNYFDALESLLNSYGEDKNALLEQLIAISFSDQMLGKLYNSCPEIPTGQLGGTYGYGDDANFYGFLKLISEINAVPNSAKNDFNDTAFAYIARGYPLYYYTYYTAAEIQSEVRKGTIGITNDMCSSVSDFIRFFDAEDNYSADINEYKTKTYEVAATTYKGEVKYYNAGVFKVLEEKGDTALVILKYLDAGGQTGGINYARYTAPVNIALTGTPNAGGDDNGQKPDKKPTSKYVYIISGASLLIGAASLVLVFVNKKRK